MRYGQWCKTKMSLVFSFNRELQLRDIQQDPAMLVPFHIKLVPLNNKKKETIEYYCTFFLNLLTYACLFLLWWLGISILFSTFARINLYLAQGFYKDHTKHLKQCLAQGKCSININISLSMKPVFKINLNGKIFLECIIVLWCYGDKKEKIQTCIC